MEDPEVKRIDDYTVEVVDPNTKGVWRVESEFKISFFGAFDAIRQTMENENIAPKEGSTVTIKTSIKFE